MLPGSHPQEKKAGLAHWANRVLEECDKASAGFAPVPVHDLRVAIRRCRSMADGFLSVDPDRAWKQMKRLAKPLFSSLGDLRDTQVMMEWVAKLSQPNDPVGESLSAALAQEEIALKMAAQDALASFDRKRWASLNAHLAKRTDRIPLGGLVFQHLALERWMEARELHRRALRNRSAVAYHRLRIGIKRFRYTVENFLPQQHKKWAKDLRELQDALGEVHDLDVLRAIIRVRDDIPADERLRWQKRVAEE
ncbi:MAG: CHAD domain-containing protein, partial [Candidatus Korobacteraceae bacterium]